MRDQNFTDPGSKGRVLRHTSTDDYYVAGEYFLEVSIFIQIFGNMRHGFWSRQHKHMSQTFNRPRLCWVRLEVIVL